ncbi:MAG: immunoglobulin domain-containing protein, partial [Chthoniobacteraceae bacterium]|nr:immunoglobulin domain-containing protein [Chthoniobacteraceae bacterium]
MSTILSGTTTDFSLNSTTAGGALVAGAPHYMRIRPMVGGQWFDFGALKTVFPTQSLSPTITSQPASLAVNVGSPASFSVTATGTGSLSCQWRKDGANIAGATSVTYTIASVQTTDAGSYSAVVSNSAGSVTSASASLTVNKAAQTIGAFGAIGSHLYGDAPFAVPVPVANSGLTVSVTLKSGPATISGGSILVNGVGIVVLAANQAGNANYTAAAEVTTSFNVNKATPTIYVWPSASSISSGQTLVSSVLSGGSASVLGAFAFSSSSTAPSVGTGTQSVTFTPTDSMRYNTVSGNVSVTVNAVLTAPSITGSPASLTVNGGSLASFNVTATGTAPLSYQWRKNSANIAGGTSSTYTIASVQTADAGSYSVVVSNSAGSVTSASASLTVNKVTPVITILPTASPITSGQSLMASVLSGGSASVARIFAFTSPSTVPSVGTTSQSVTFTPTDSSRYTPV